MSNEEIIEGNKLISEFMGMVRREPNKTYRLHQWYKPDNDLRKTGQFIGYDDSLEYHTSWGWLMPVIEKMAKLKLKYADSEQEYSPHPNTFGMVDEEGNFMVRIYCSQLFHAPTLIEASWLAVVDFLKWYTKENQAPIPNHQNNPAK